MLHGARSLCSVVLAFARLAHVLSRALMSLCSPTASAAATWQLHHQPGARAAAAAPKKVHPVAAALGVDVDRPEHQHHHQHQPLLLSSSPPPAAPPPLLFKGEGNKAAPEETSKKKATASNSKTARGRPPRLVIPPPVARAAGADPFGAAADRETDVATEVEVRGEGFCLASRRGVRHAMEDGYGVITDHCMQGGSKLAFYGVYDGHGGRAAVDFVADRLGRNVVAAIAAAMSHGRGGGGEDEVDDGGVVAAAIRSAYLSTDSEFLSQEGVRGGACAATALVKDGELYVAHVGDCRAVLGSRGGAATALTSDHTAGREDERRRIEAQGGYVSRGGSGVWRVQDCLAVSRAFGDASMKPWVSCEPEVSRRRLTPDCGFLLVASDGLWNKVSCQEAVDVVHAAGTPTSTSAAMGSSCKELVAMAKARGSRDDITVMLVDLQRFLR